MNDISVYYFNVNGQKCSQAEVQDNFVVTVEDVSEEGGPLQGAGRRRGRRGEEDAKEQVKSKDIH